MFRNAYGFKHRLLPEAASSFYSSDRIHDTKCQDSFNGSRYDTQDEGLCIVFVPGLYVERKRR